MSESNKHLMRLYHVLDTELSDTMLVTEYLEPLATVPAIKGLPVSGRCLSYVSLPSPPWPGFSFIETGVSLVKKRVGALKRVPCGKAHVEKEWHIPGVSGMAPCGWSSG